MVIGVTGRIGSGKSTVVSFFSQWGAQIIDVDKLGWEILEEKQQEIKEAFGVGIFRKGEVDRKELGKIIFEAPEKKRILDSIIHPPLIKELKSQVSGRKSQVSPINQDFAGSTSLLVVDCALIYEWGIEGWFDKIILVTSSHENKLQRLVNLGYTKKEAEERIHAQMPDNIKTPDWVLENNGNLRTLEQNARRIWDSLIVNR